MLARIDELKTKISELKNAEILRTDPKQREMFCTNLIITLQNYKIFHNKNQINNFDLQDIVMSNLFPQLFPLQNALVSGFSREIDLLDLQKKLSTIDLKLKNHYTGGKLNNDILQEFKKVFIKLVNMRGYFYTFKNRQLKRELWSLKRALEI